MRRSAGVRLRTTKGNATRVGAVEMRAGEAGKSNGDRFKATMNPNPNVTAEVPRGSIKIGSSQRLSGASPARASAQAAGRASPKASATVVNAYVRETRMAWRGGTNE